MPIHARQPAPPRGPPPAGPAEPAPEPAPEQVRAGGAPSVRRLAARVYVARACNGGLGRADGAAQMAPLHIVRVSVAGSSLRAALSEHGLDLSPDLCQLVLTRWELISQARAESLAIGLERDPAWAISMTPR